MNTWCLLLLRMYSITFGRIPLASLLFRKGLVYLFVKKAKEKYVAASRYFDCKKFAGQEKGRDSL